MKILKWGLVCFAIALGAWGLFRHFYPKPEHFLTPSPAGAPKAVCIPKINHVNVLFLQNKNIKNPKEVKISAKNIADIDPEMMKAAQTILSNFWDGEVSLINTSSPKNLYPGYWDHITLGFKKNNGKIGVFIVTYSKINADYSFNIKTNSEMPENKDSSLLYPIYSPSFLHLSGVKYKQRDYDLFIQTLNDFVVGRCDRNMSRHVSSDKRDWKFFKPFESYNDLVKEWSAD